MKNKLEEIINHVQKSNKLKEEDKPLILEKLEEWREEEDAINDVAGTFQRWWIELEPIFAELGLV